MPFINSQRDVQKCMYDWRQIFPEKILLIKGAVVEEGKTHHLMPKKQFYHLEVYYNFNLVQVWQQDTVLMTHTFIGILFVDRVGSTGSISIELLRSLGYIEMLGAYLIVQIQLKLTAYLLFSGQGDIAYCLGAPALKPDCPDVTTGPTTH